MGLSDVMRSLEKRINKRGVRRKTESGWVPVINAFRGYGTEQRVHIIGRVLMEDPCFNEEGRGVINQAERGYRQFFTIQVGDFPVTVCAGNQRVGTYTDANGYFDVLVEDPGLEPGWQEVTIESEGAASVTTQVLITSPETKIGLVTDVDDTIMVTNLPRATLAAYNSWFKHTNTRQPVDGMAEFYTEMLRDHPDAPVFYLSTGAWNTYETLENFVEKHEFPAGPMLLTDWGPTPTGLFRSGQEHKNVQLRNLFIDYPEIQWILVGDNGQHDPLIYGAAVDEHPDRVLGVAIRELTPTEHVLSHGTTTAMSRPPRTDRSDVPTITGADGFELLDAYRRSFKALEE